MQTSAKPKKSLLRYLRLRDLIVIVVGLALGSWINHGYFFREPTDYEKWLARPKLDHQATLANERKQRTGGPDPCLFIVPTGTVDQPVVSGSVGDCLMLVPDGKKLDLYEVVLWFGDFFQIRTDLYVKDTIPLAFTRTYNSSDTLADRIHTYLRHVYDPYLYGDRNPYTYLRWVLPDGVHLYYGRVSPGTAFADAIYEDASSFPVFGGSRIGWNGWGWDLALADGMTYLSPEAYNATRPQQGSLIGIFDQYGNEVRLKRKADGDLTEITSPSGRWIRLSYESGQLSRAVDSSGSATQYTYDRYNRLLTTRDSHGQTTEYEYISFKHIARAINSRGSVAFENAYDMQGRLIQVTLPDGSSYHLDYVFDEQRKSGHVDITDSKGQLRRVTLTARPEEGKPFYTVEQPGRDAAHK
jgi:YD repeat-containing protein